MDKAVCPFSVSQSSSWLKSANLKEQLLYLVPAKDGSEEHYPDMLTVPAAAAAGTGAPVSPNQTFRKSSRSVTKVHYFPRRYSVNCRSTIHCS